MKKILDGNKACSYVSYNFVEASGIYPITPSSPMAEGIDEFSKIDKKKNFWGNEVKVHEMQSEAGAIALCHGLLQNGIFSTTYTASQGLLLMLPNMYKIAGELLPFVINVASRSLATFALSIFGDHQDIYAARTTGFGIFHSSSVEQVMDLTSIPYLVSIESKIPFINSFDGFRTSHELQKVDLIDMNEVKKLIDKESVENFRNRALLNHKITRGSNLNDDLYFQLSEAHQVFYDQVPDIAEKYLKEISRITKREYHIFDYYGDPNAKKVIVAMGSVCETIRKTIDLLGGEIGLLEVHLFRPFSKEYFNKFLPQSVEKIAVLDRTQEFTSNPPLYLDVKSALDNKDIEVIGGRYGLSSRDTDIFDIKAVYDFLDKENKFNDFTIGIIDDLRHKSLEKSYFDFNEEDEEIIIYGFGSDGMVSASKDLISIIGNNTDNYVQAYFEYDSKKSGGLTRSHLRISDKKIKATHYVNHPSLVVCTKSRYLSKYNMLENIKENGIFLLNTFLTDEELNQVIPDRTKKILKERNIKFYKVNASKIAIDNNLNGITSGVMETLIFRLSKKLDFNFAIRKMKENIVERFNTKGEEVIKNNHNLIDDSLNALEEVNLNKLEIGLFDFSDDLYSKLTSKRGYSVKVSEVFGHVDGTFKGGMSKNEKRAIADFMPLYNSENCITCNRCSFVCPHGVIRPFLLTEEEKNNAPEYIQNKLIKANIPGKDYYFIIGVSYKDCTGCGLCFDTCPGKMMKKALKMESASTYPEEFKKINDYLFENITEKKDAFNKYTVKGSQFIKPGFEFSGACQGCGETAYIRILTQLFKDEIGIANATGCSSIYGGEVPSTTYNVPWANSLFEDNAEFGMGIKIADNLKKEKIKKLIRENLNNLDNKEIYEAYLEDINEESAKRLYEEVDNSNILELIEMKKDIMPKSMWIIGGDGWAYDIGFSGIDHVLSSGEDVNILVLDTEVYSNTGGQASKASKIASVNKFSSDGKKQAKKDLARIAMSYPNVYVAQVALGANMKQTIDAFKEAKEHKGPSIIIAYSPCIEHKIIGGMSNSNRRQKLAVEAGYFPIFRYNPIDNSFKLDAKADFSKYQDFLMGENRYKVLHKINEKEADNLLNKNEEEALRKYNYYKNLEEIKNE